MPLGGDALAHAFVREALLALESVRPALWDSARAVRDWERALSIADTGSVAGDIGAAMALRGVQDEFPETARSVFEEAHAGATERSALQLSEPAEVQVALDAAGIASVELKGPGPTEPCGQ